MNDEKFFLHPKFDWQRRYEALRASFFERLPARIVADRYGYTTGYVYLLRHMFIHGKIDFSEPVPEGKTKRRGVSTETRGKIRRWRQGNLSAGEIVQLLSEDGIELSVRTVERVLAEEGFPKLPRRTRIQIGRTVAGAIIPEASSGIDIRQMEGARFDCTGGGAFLFAPFIEKLDIRNIIKESGLPGTSAISSESYLLSFLALKLLGSRRYAHAPKHAFDPGLGLFAGLNVLPKCTAMSTYSYRLDNGRLQGFQKAFVQRANKLGLYDRSIINLDFHTIPHFGEESVFEQHWAGARNRAMKGALTLFAQDAQSKLIVYTAADIQRAETNDQVLDFMKFWKKCNRGVKPTLVFDSRFTTYKHLSELNEQGVMFITLRRRGKKLIESVDRLEPWVRVRIPHAKRKYPRPLVHDSVVALGGYEGTLRQVVVRDNGREKPTFLISNDFNAPVELIVGNYARRWRVENAISEAVDFFNLNAMSSPILVKVHFDVILTMIADTLYSMLASKLRGFEHCDAEKIHRNFVRGKAIVKVENGVVTVNYKRKAHNPILRAVPWHRLPSILSWLDGARLQLNFD